ncbi:TVP38/TMEM64 family inner membrane protein YdjZ [compost metagenome]
MCHVIHRRPMGVRGVDGVIEVIMQSATQWVEALRSMGGTGSALYALVFLLATVAFVPASPLTAIAGFLYGPVGGTLLVSPVGMASAMIAFVMGRTFLRPFVLRRLTTRPRQAAIDRALARDGFRIVLLLRLASIVPFAPLSYALGASRISARDFLLASWLGLLPGTFLYVYLGSLVSSVSDILSGEATAGNATHVLTGMGLAAAVLALLSIAHCARKAANQSIEKALKHE